MLRLLTVTGWAPHESQQKPLQPGTALHIGEMLWGNIGTALAQYRGFRQRGFTIVGVRLTVLTRPTRRICKKLPIFLFFLCSL